jgi:hypothetical protein
VENYCWKNKLHWENNFFTKKNSQNNEPPHTQKIHGAPFWTLVVKVSTNRVPLEAIFDVGSVKFELRDS